MNSVTTHIPAWGDAEKTTHPFHTLRELLAIPFVKAFSKGKSFHRFSVSTDNSLLLMAEYDKGRGWWVVGRLKTPVNGLPEWLPIKATPSAST